MQTIHETQQGSGSLPVLGGPQTSAGKDISRFNATKHGFYDQRIVIESLGERQEDFDALVARFTEDFHPLGITEECLVRELAAQTWRMRRGNAFETAVVTEQLQAVDKLFAEELSALDRENVGARELVQMCEQCIALFDAIMGGGPCNWDEVYAMNWEVVTDKAFGLLAPGEQTLLRGLETAEAIHTFVQEKLGWKDTDVQGPLREYYVEFLAWVRGQMEGVRRREREVRERYRIARALAGIPAVEVTDKLQRYMHGPERKFQKTLEMLLALQRLRRQPQRVLPEKIQTAESVNGEQYENN